MFRPQAVRFVGETFMQTSGDSFAFGATESHTRSDNSPIFERLWADGYSTLCRVKGVTNEPKRKPVGGFASARSLFLRLETFQYGLDEQVDAILIVCVGFFDAPIGNDHAYRGGFMPQKGTQPGHGRTLHFEIGDTKLVVFERFNFCILMWVGQWDAKLPALRAEEASCHRGDSSHHVATGYALDQFHIGCHRIGSR